MRVLAVGGERVTARSSPSNHRPRAIIQRKNERYSRHFAQVRPIAGLEEKTNEKPCHLLFLGALDLLGFRDGVFPGVVLLSRRR